MNQFATSIEQRKSLRAARMAISAIFFCCGLCFASWASRIPTIQQKLELSESALGGLLLSLPAGSFLSLPLSAWLVKRFGSKKVVVIATFLYAVVLVNIGLPKSIAHMVAVLFCFGLLGNLLNISANTQAVGIETSYRKNIMASMHGMWSLAGFTGAAIGTFMIGQQVEVVWHYLLVAGVVLLILLPSISPLQNRDTNNAGGKNVIFALPDRPLLVLGLIAFCSMMCEGAMFDWSGVYFKTVVQAPPELVGAGYTTFMITMAATRFVADRLVNRFGIARVFRTSGLFTAAGLLLAVAFPALPTAIAGFFIVGMGVSAVVPLVFSAAGKSTAMSTGTALAAVSSMGFFGFLFGPPLIGFIAGASSLRVSFSVMAALAMCIVLLAGHYRPANPNITG